MMPDFFIPEMKLVASKTHDFSNSETSLIENGDIFWLNLYENKIDDFCLYKITHYGKMFFIDSLDEKNIATIWVKFSRNCGAHWDLFVYATIFQPELYEEARTLIKLMF
jgi:hypothetical protein